MPDKNNEILLYLRKHNSCIVNNKIWKLYMCGPTSYKNMHLGNLRSQLFFDLLVSCLKQYTKVKYVTNITDVDMKILKVGEWDAHSYTRYVKQTRNKIIEIFSWFKMNKPYAVPGIILPNNSFDGIREFIKEMKPQQVVNGLLWKDFYVWRNLDSTYNIKLHEKYTGIPGWHVTCAYFIYRYFGKQGVDIHGGGADIKAHHKAENLMYNCVCKNEISKNWFYIELLTNKNGKISKTSTFDNIESYLKNFSIGGIKLYIYKNNYYSKTVFSIIDLLNANNDFELISMYLYIMHYEYKQELQSSLYKNTITLDRFIYKYILSNSCYLINQLLKLLNKLHKNLFERRLCYRIITLYKLDKIGLEHIKNNINKYKSIFRWMQIRSYYREKNLYNLSDKIKNGIIQTYRTKYFNIYITDIENNSKITFRHY